MLNLSIKKSCLIYKEKFIVKLQGSEVVTGKKEMVKIGQTVQIIKLRNIESSFGPLPWTLLLSVRPTSSLLSQRDPLPSDGSMKFDRCPG
jgi:hypothetical protein